MQLSKMGRRAFLQLAATTTAGAFLVACAPVTAPAAGGSAVAAASTPLIYWNYMTDMEEIESKILDAFKAGNTDTELSYEYVPWQQYWEKLNATLAAGNPPDLWNTAPTFYYEYILRKQLVDLTDTIAEKVDMSTFHKTALNGYDFKDRTYGMPRNIVTTVVYFNKTLFDAAGVETPPLDGNWTWADMAEKAKALTKDEVWGTQALLDPWWIDPAIMGNGADIFIGEFTRDLQGMTANYDSEIAVSTFKYFSDLVNVDKTAFPSGQFQGMGSPFMTGKVGMVYDLNWGPHTYKDATFEWDMTMMPKGDKSQLTYGGADGLVVSQATKNIDGAWKLIGWLIDPKTGGDFLTQSGAMPVIKTKEVIDAYLNTFPDKNIQALVSSADIATSVYTLGYNEWKDAFKTELDKAYLGQKPVDQMAADATAAVNASFDRIRSEFAGGAKS